MRRGGGEGEKEKRRRGREGEGDEEKGRRRRRRRRRRRLGRMPYLACLGDRSACGHWTAIRQMALYTPLSGLYIDSRTFKKR